ncbi:MAG: biopolymer transporter ExbD [Elusimicrobia bacterium]|nr:biopolymer transporter ExbD [Elusimicrobiota bacterium]
MAIGSGSRGEEPITEINVTPLVDVCLVLVIIFMAVAPMAMSVGIKVLESRAKAAEGKASLSENVQIRLTSSGVITINGVNVPRQALGSQLVRALATSKDKMVIITADAVNRVGQVVDILDTAQQAGAQKLAILKSEG